MTYAQARIEELMKISKLRDLTQDEQKDLLLRVKQARRHAKRLQLYRTDPVYRMRRIQRARDYREAQRASA